MFCTLTFVSADFLRYACYPVVCAVQIILVIAFSIILNMAVHFVVFCGFFFFHLTERQAMMLGHMSSLEGHASYKPLSVGKIAFFLFLIFTSSLKFTLVCFLTLFFPAIFPTHYVLNTLSNFYFSFKAYISPNCFPPTQWVMYVYSILEFHF